MALGASNSDLDRHIPRNTPDSSSKSDAMARFRENIALLLQKPFVRFILGALAICLVIVGLMPSAQTTPSAGSSAPQTGGGSLYGGTTAPVPSAPVTTPTQAFAPPSAPDWMQSTSPDNSVAGASSQPNAAFGDAASTPQDNFTSTLGPITITGSQSVEEAEPVVSGTTSGGASKSPVTVTPKETGSEVSAPGVKNPAATLDDVFRE